MEVSGAGDVGSRTAFPIGLRAGGRFGGSAPGLSQPRTAAHAHALVCESPGQGRRGAGRRAHGSGSAPPAGPAGAGSCAPNMVGGPRAPGRFPGALDAPGPTGAHGRGHGGIARHGRPLRPAQGCRLAHPAGTPGRPRLAQPWRAVRKRHSRPSGGPSGTRVGTGNGWRRIGLPGPPAPQKPARSGSAPAGPVPAPGPAFFWRRAAPALAHLERTGTCRPGPQVAQSGARRGSGEAAPAHGTPRQFPP